MMLRLGLVLLCSFMGSAFANIVGTNVSNFNPTTSGLDYVTVQSPYTLKPGFFNLGLFVNQAGNSLPKIKDGDGNGTTLSDRLTYGDFNFGLGVFKNIDIGLSFPILLAQNIDEETQNVLFSDTGPTEIRANIKYRFLKINDWDMAFILSNNFNLIDNNPYVGENGGNTYNTELALGRNLGIYSFAVNMGYRFRDPGDPIEDSELVPVGNQYIASLGVSRNLTSYDTKLIFELLMSLPAEDVTGYDDKELSSYEALLGIKHDYTKKIAFHAGAGVGLVDGTTSPDWRVYTGLNWNFGPIWGKSARVKKIKVRRKIKERRKYKRIRRYRLENLNFDTNLHKLHATDISEVTQLLKVLRGRSDKIVKLIVEGHTDSVGSYDSNIELSRNRAREIKRLIVKYAKIEPQLIQVVGRGDTKPIADNGNYQGRSENRRVEVLAFE